MEENICSAHVKRFSLLIYLFFLEDPSHIYAFVCFGRLVSFLSVEKAAQFLPLKSHSVCPTVILLLQVCRIKSPKITAVAGLACG